MLRTAFLVSLTALTLACSSDPGAPSPSADAGVLPANGVGSATSVALTVAGLNGLVPGVEVVFHDARGAVLATAVTGSDGNAFSDSAGVTMVTAAIVHGYNRRLVTWTGVEPGDRLQLSDILATDPVGAYLVTATGAARTDFVRDARIGRCSGEHFAQDTNEAPIELRLRPDCLGTPPLTLVVTGTAASTSAMTWLSSAPVSAVPGATVNVSVPVTWSKTTFAGKGAIELRDFPATGAPTFVATAPVASGLLYADLETTAWTRGAPVSFGTDGEHPYDAYQVQVDERASTSIQRGVIKRVAPDTRAPLPYDELLPLLADPKLDVTSGARPVMTWSGDTGGAEGGIVNLAYQRDGLPIAWSILVPRGATRAAAPALPADLASWVPGVDDASTVRTSAVVVVRSDLLDARRLRETYGKLFQLWTKTTAFPAFPALPANGTLAWSGAFVQ